MVQTRNMVRQEAIRKEYLKASIKINVLSTPGIASKLTPYDNGFKINI